MLSNFLKKQNINKGIDEFKAASGAVLLDVRTRDEYREGHVPGSKNIDVAKIGSAVSLIGEKSTPVFVYCYSGSRSGVAVNALKGLGYVNVKNIGGISSYTGIVERGE